MTRQEQLLNISAELVDLRCQIFSNDDAIVRVFGYGTFDEQQRLLDDVLALARRLKFLQHCTDAVIAGVRMEINKC